MEGGRGVWGGVHFVGVGSGKVGGGGHTEGGLEEVEGRGEVAGVEGAFLEEAGAGEGFWIWRWRLVFGRSRGMREEWRTVRIEL